MILSKLKKCFRILLLYGNIQICNIRPNITKGFQLRCWNIAKCFFCYSGGKLIVIQNVVDSMNVQLKLIIDFDLRLEENFNSIQTETNSFNQ